jgi:hypothetical protein
VSCILLLPTLAAAHGSNPNHLSAYLISPFGVTGKITSPAPTHHTPYLGDLSMDVSIAGGSAGYAVYFDGQAIGPATAVRAKVLQGGANALIPACASGRYSDGGYRVQLEIQVYNNGVWTPIGWVWYAHVDGILKNNGEILADPTRFAKVTSQYNSAVGCSNAPHLHLELYNYYHYAGYVPRAEGTTFGIYDALGCLGGAQAEDQPCP